MSHRIYIDAEPITREKMSGVGHTVLEMIRELDAVAVREDLRLTLIVPFGSVTKIRTYGFQNVYIRRLPPGRRVVNYLLSRVSLPLPVDVWFGRGIYLFLDYKNWSVPFSRSVTVIYDLAFRVFPDTVNPRNRVYLERNISRWLKRTDIIMSISDNTTGSWLAIIR
jgi:hypothetical protein